MIQCPKCGKVLPDDARFCDECGAVIAQQPSAPSYFQQAPSMPQAAPAAEAAPAPMPQAASAPEAPQQAPYIPYNGMQPQQPQQAPSQGVPFCPNCGAPSSGTPFCTNCGAPMGAAPAGNVPKAKKSKAPKAPKAPKENGGKGSKKGILIGAIAAAAVVVVVLVVILLSGGKGKKSDGKLLNEAIYLQDGEIFYSDLSKDGENQISDNLFSNISVDKEEMADDADTIGYEITISGDGKYIFYPDRSDYDGYSLYYRNLKKLNAGSVKIDSDIRGYFIPEENSNLVFYHKEGSSWRSYTLYVYDIKAGEKTKLASDVTNWIVTDDGKTVIYVNTDLTMYRLPVGGEKEKLDSDVTNMGWMDDSFKSIWYLKSDVLYSRVLGKDKERIDSEVSYVEGVYNGILYYVKSEEAEYLYRELITDDMKNIDANLEAPVSPEYPNYSDYNDDDAYSKALEEYDEAYDQYWDELEIYWARDTREAYRQQPCEDKYTVTEDTLYSYNGKEKEKFVENFRSMSRATEDGKMIIRTYGAMDDCGFNLSQLTDYSTWGANDILSGNRYDLGKVFYYNGSSMEEIVMPEDAYVCNYDEDLTTVYYMLDINDEKSIGTLYSMKLPTGDAVMIDEEVYMYRVGILDIGVFYFKDYDSSKSVGDLFIDGKEVGFDVYGYGMQYFDELETLFFLTDYNSSREEATLNSYKKGKTEVVAQDVVAFAPLADGSVLVLSDYSVNSHTGELYLIKGSKKTKIADDVIALLNNYIR